MPYAEGQVGPQTLSDGAPGEIRLDRTKALVGTDAHARYQEATLRGNVYTISSTNASLSGVTSTSAGSTPIVGLVNPIGSGRAAVVLRGGAVLTAINSTGTAAAGNPSALAWSYGISQTVTAAQNATPLPNLLASTGGTSVMRGYSQTALTGAGALIPLRLINGWAVTTSTGASWLTTVTGTPLEETAGDIIVPPGNILTVACVTTSTNAAAQGAITYEEITYP